MGKGDTFDSVYDHKDDGIGSAFISPLKYKFMPPLLPSKDSTIHQLKHITDSYLCKDCCSHKMVRMQTTMHGSLDIIECYAGSNPSILLPRVEAQNATNFQLASFVCACRRKALICEIDMKGRQRFLNNLGNPDDQQLFEMMRVGGGMVYRNQRVLMIKDLELESTSYYKGLQQAKADQDNDYRKKIRGYAMEVEQREGNRETLEAQRLLWQLKNKASGDKTPEVKKAEAESFARSKFMENLSKTAATKEDFENEVKKQLTDDEAFARLPPIF